MNFYAFLVLNAESTRKFFDYLRNSNPRLPNITFHEKEHTTAIQEGIRHRQFFFEVLLVRTVENYLNYFSSLLFEIFTERPETMKSSETVTLESVLKHENMSEFVRSIAEKKVISMSYNSFPEFISFFNKRFDIDITNQNDESTIVEAIQIRNIAVHNRGRIDARYVSRTGKGGDRIGKERSLFVHDIEKIAPCVLKSVIKTDKQARKKLSIHGKRFRIEDEINPVPPVDVIEALTSENKDLENTDD